MTENFTPYYAVIFTSVRTEQSIELYANTANKMMELAQLQDGFLGVESARNEIGITVSYWRDLDAIKKWKQNADHLLAQSMGQEKFYLSYTTRICKVEREYSFKK